MVDLFENLVVIFLKEVTVFDNDVDNVYINIEII